MTTLSQTYSKSVSLDQILGFFQSRSIANKIEIEQHADWWYVFSSDYFSEYQLHDILDDLCDSVLEAAE